MSVTLDCTADSKRPRQLAHDIYLTKGVKRRRAMLEQVPEDWRGLVKTYLTIWWGRK